MTISYDRTTTPWARLDELFHRACELPSSEVAAFCEREAGGDDELRQILYELVMAADIGDEAIRDSVKGLAQDVASGLNLTGERVGAYQFGDLLGRGGMGEVYQANRADGEFEKTVAIKVVHTRLNQEEFVRHFRTERQVLANLHHANIPALIDAGQLPDGRPYFITHYIDGVPIDQYCEAQRLTLRQRLDLIEALCDAVAHAHSMLALHLDIKPANVLVDKSGAPKLLDFGITRLMGDPDSGHKAFTPEYASPEQIRGESPTAASDVFSLGILMFRLLTGEEPFEVPRYAPRATRLAERADLPERVARTSAAMQLDTELRHIVGKAMHPSRDERYPTVHTLLSDLRRYRLHLPVRAMTNSLAYRVRKYVRRHTIGLTLGIAMVGMMTLYIVREIQLRKEAQLAYATAEQEATAARQVSSFLTSLFRVSDPGDDRANSLTARELLDRGAESISRDLVDQPAIAGRLMRTIGDVYVLLGMHSESIGLFEEAIDLLERGSSPVEDISLAQKGLGDAYTRVGRFDEARTVLENSLQQLDGQADSTARAVALYTLGTLHMREGRSEEAEAVLLRARAAADRVLTPDDPEHGKFRSALANVYFEMGRNDEAEALYLEAIDVIERAYGSNYPHLANEIESLGNLYNEMQRYDEASTNLKRSLALREAALSGDHPLVSYSLMNLSALYVNSDRLDEAEPYLLRAINIQERIFPPDDYRLNLSRANLAELRFKRGNLSAALALANQALGSFERQLEPGHRFIGHVTALLGQIYAARGEREAADTMFERALAIFRDRPAADPVRRHVVEIYTEHLRATGREGQADTLLASPDR